MTRPTAAVAVLGGTGFYTFLEDATEIAVDTPYGPPSDKVTVGAVGDLQVAFLPRHGRDHRLPPHEINYAANLWALRELGVRRVIGPAAVGSLKAQVKPGDIVICDQFVDRTHGRRDTYFDGPVTTHVSLADPYCPQLRELGTKAARETGARAHENGTMVVIQGPRFATRAESRWYSAQGCDVINMTGYPEAALARELELCYVNLSMVTDYDVGLDGAEGIDPVSHQEVRDVLTANQAKLRNLLFTLLRSLPEERSCACGSALENARL